MQNNPYADRKSFSVEEVTLMEMISDTDNRDAPDVKAAEQRVEELLKRPPASVAASSPSSS